MTFTNFRNTLVLPLLFISQVASAGIIDTDRDSFIDDTTGLEWLDINMTTNKSYNYVASNLGQGQEYEGWRLPNFNEVVQLIMTTFNNNPYRFIEYPNSNGFEIHAQNNITFDSTIYKSVFEDAFQAIGYGKAFHRNGDSDPFFVRTRIQFTDNLGNIANVSFENFYIQEENDQVHLDASSNPAFEIQSKIPDDTFGTFLVKGTSTATTTQVSEPAMLSA